VGAVSRIPDAIMLMDVQYQDFNPAKITCFVVLALGDFSPQETVAAFGDSCVAGNLIYGRATLAAVECILQVSSSMG